MVIGSEAVYKTLNYLSQGSNGNSHLVYVAEFDHLCLKSAVAETLKTKLILEIHSMDMECVSMALDRLVDFFGDSLR